MEDPGGAVAYITDFLPGGVGVHPMGINGNSAVFRYPYYDSALDIRAIDGARYPFQHR